MDRLPDDVTAVLLKPIAAHRVKTGTEGSLKGLSYVEAYEIRAMLNRIFGFAMWSLEETTPTVCVVEKEWELRNSKPGIKVAYRAHCRSPSWPPAPATPVPPSAKRRCPTT